MVVQTHSYRFLSYKTILFFLGLIFSAEFLSAQPLDPEKRISQYHHEFWQVEDGLPQNSVLAIEQTYEGYLWLGTYDGLSRFDGVRFDVFNSVDYPELGNSYVSSLFESSDSTLWIGTSGSGLFFYKDAKLQKYESERPIPDKNILTITESTDGAIWLGTFGAGVIRIKEGKTTFFEGKQIPHQTIETALARSDGSVMFGTRGAGIFNIRGNQVSAFVGNKKLTNLYIRTLFQRGDRLWVGTSGGGVVGFDGNNVEIINRKNGLNSDVVEAIYEDEAGTLWIGMQGGGLNRRTKAGKFDHFGTNDGLTNDGINTILHDREGNLWLGTGGGGLYKLKDGAFTSFTTKEGLAGSHVWSTFVDRKNQTWVGTDGNGLDLIKIGRVVRNYSVKDGLPNNYIRSIYEDSKGNIWVGTYGGVAKISPNGTISVLNEDDGILGNIVLAIYEDRFQRMWFGLTGEGAAILEKGKITHFTTRNGLRNGYVRTFLHDSKQRFWIGTGGGGVTMIQNNLASTFSEEEGLSNNTVIALYEDKEGAIWIGTHGGGLNKWEGGRIVGHVSVGDGMLDDVIFSILPDENDRLWMSSNKGVFNVALDELNAVIAGNKKKASIRAYGKNDGMKTSECNGANFPAAYKGPDGRMWFATMMGVTSVHPERIHRNEVSPNVLITGVMLDQMKSILTTPNPVIRGSAHRLDFMFTAISFYAPNKIQFEYMLEGLDTEWKSNSNQRIVSYTNLPPNPYRFKVKAKSVDGIYSAQEASFSFLVPTPLYQTWGAFLIYASILFFGIWSYVERQKNNVARMESERFEKEQLKLQAEKERLLREKAESEAREHQREVELELQRRRALQEAEKRELDLRAARSFTEGVEEERSRIARDLHDDILGKLATVMRKIQSTTRKQRADLAEELGQLFADMEALSQDIRMIMDDLHPATIDLFTIGESLEVSIRKIMETVDKQVEFYVENEIEDVKFDHFTTISIYRLFQEALTNAIKQETVSSICLSLKQDKSTYIIQLHDNGTGFKAQEMLAKVNIRSDRRGHGLINMLHRSKTIGARLTWSDSPKGGAKVELVIPKEKAL